MVEDRRLYRIIAPHSAVTHYICLCKLAFVLLRATSAFRFASAPSQETWHLVTFLSAECKILSNFLNAYAFWSFSLLNQIKIKETSYDVSFILEDRRFELLTPCVQSRCSTSWANPPHTQAYAFSLVNLRKLTFAHLPLGYIYYNTWWFFFVKGFFIFIFYNFFTISSKQIFTCA